MKVKVSPILLGIVLVGIALYVYKQWTTPTVKLIVQKEGFAENNAGSIIGMVFASILGIGIVFAFFAGLSEVGKH